MKIVELNRNNSILNQYLAEIRDVNIQGDSLRFRRNIERVGEIMAYEISRDLPYQPLEIQTPLAMATENVPTIQRCTGDSLTISTALRMLLFRLIANT